MYIIQWQGICIYNVKVHVYTMIRYMYIYNDKVYVYTMIRKNVCLI